MLDYDTLKFLWWVIIAVVLIAFALTDGYDMGAGVLLPFLGKSDDERRVLLNVLAPHWDGNQVWFITGAAALFAAWPMLYAAAFSTFYLVLLATLWTLLLRPGAFEYRGKIDNPQWRYAWDWALFIGCAVPATIFGAAFGNLMLGVPFTLDNDLRTTPGGTLLGQLHPFALLTGITGLALLVMHGAAYLGLRTEGILRHRVDWAARVFAAVVAIGFASAGVWLGNLDGFRVVTMPPADTVFSPLAKTVAIVPGGWLTNYTNYPWTMAIPVVGFLGAIGVAALTGRGKGIAAVIASSIAVVGVILTAGVTLFPFVLPSLTQPNASLTVWDAVSSHRTLNLMFWAVVVFLPIILAYTYWAYRVMWRRLTVEDVRKETHTLY